MKTASRRSHIFLLSPANIAGRRASLLLNPKADFELAIRLRDGSATLGEVFSFTSGLYFRGKLAYASAFADAPAGIAGAFVITAGGGLVPPETLVTLKLLRKISAAQIDCSDSRYRLPLERDARALAESAGPHCDIVLLGSIATRKYVEPLLDIFGDRLLLPAEFVGRGDMSRGGLMLRCVSAASPLAYIPVRNAARHGVKPPKLLPV